MRRSSSSAALASTLPAPALAPERPRVAVHRVRGGRLRAVCVCPECGNPMSSTARVCVSCGDDGITWEECYAFVDSHPSGATLDEVGQALGVCRERIRQIEAVALRKLARVLTRREVASMLAARAEADIVVGEGTRRSDFYGAMLDQRVKDWWGFR